uniref:17S U2 SnRNP complex component HTATSF1 n=1 Tax=Parascaris univalens TaxID=6257 RepID=A0A915B0R2_PARUN
MAENSDVSATVDGANEKPEEAESGTDLTSVGAASSEPERRFIDGKWICEDGNGGFLVYENEKWVVAEGDNLHEKWSTAADAKFNPYRCVVDGITMEWNEISQQWLPAVEVDEDFLARYNASYGIEYDFGVTEGSSSKNVVAEGESTPKKPKPHEKTKEEGWVELDETKNAAVYVSNLPKTITEDAFIELMSKCGVIQRDARTNKLKVKIYRGEEGEPKGDARCGYVKKESVDLALQILDGWNLDGNLIHVEKAKFQMKGEFDPSKKRRKLTAAQKKRFIENQQRLFEWRPEKPRNYRPFSDCTAVMKNMFTMEQMMRNPTLLMDLQEQTKKACERFGTVKKVVVHDNNPDGVICVTFDNVEHSDLAVRSMNGLVVGGRKIEVSTWDGKTKYAIAETPEQREQRIALWQKFIEEGEASPAS